MVSTKPLLLAATTLLTTISPVSAIPKKHPIILPGDPLTDQDQYRKFNIKIRRYRDNFCTHPAATYGDFGVQKGVPTYIPEPKDSKGECHSWVDGDPFLSYDFKWEPKEGYKGKQGKDDPTLAPNEGHKFCWIKVFESEDCHGNEVNHLPFANQWENIGACHGGFEMQGGSVKVHCMEVGRDGKERGLA